MPSFDDLPNELLHMVAQQLCDADLKSVRLLARRPKDIANEYFPKNVRLAMTPKSFEKFNNITNHVTLGSKVEKLVFDRRVLLHGQEPAASKFQSWCNHVAEKYAMIHPLQEDTILSVIRRSANKFRKSHRLYQDLAQWQYKMAQTDSTMDYLNAFFRKLPGLKSLKLEYYRSEAEIRKDGWVGWYQPHHFLHAFEGSAMIPSWLHKGARGEEGARELHIGRVMDACYRSGIKLEELTLSGIYMLHFIRTFGSLAAQSNPISSLHYLDLTFSDDDDDLGFAGLVPILASAKCLKTLHLSFSYRDSVTRSGRVQNISSIFAPAYHWPKLEELWLSDVDTEIPLLRSFLVNHASTLRRLELADVRLPKFEACTFSFLAEKLALEDFKFTGWVPDSFAMVRLHEKFEIEAGYSDHIKMAETRDTNPNSPFWSEDCIKYRIERYVCHKGDHDVPLRDCVRLATMNKELTPIREIDWVTLLQERDGSCFTF